METSLRLKPAPHQRGTRTIKEMMLEFTAVLAVIWIYAIIFNFTAVGIENNVKNGLNAIGLGVVSIVVAVLCDLVVGLIAKKKGKELLDYLVGSYSYVTGLILALTLPVNTSYFAVIIASIFGTLVGKLLFGGFGHNIVNPAGIGRIFAGLTFGLGKTAIEIDTLSGGTITGNIAWNDGFIPGGYTLKQLFFGNYVGAMGETCTLLLLLACIYLCIRGIIDYRLCGSYFLTTFLIALFLGIFFKVPYVLSYAVLHMCVGGLAFGGVFMVTDPVTTPTSPLGKVIYGIGAGLLTMLIRVCGNLPEGVVFSIVLMNLFVPLIDTAIKGNNKDKIWKKWLVVVIGLIIAVLVNIGFAALKF